ncbi:Zn-dependent exopeptidase [Neoconidiobolus thromboides FSU 785]|nr:Zn-dependent exopeptidase [Neoconidiobolus thromboides FSU 785]
MISNLNLTWLSLTLSLLTSTHSQIINQDQAKLDLSYLKPNVHTLVKALDNNSTFIWDRLAEMTDLYGHRITGSKGLEDSIKWIVKNLKQDGIDVHTEPTKADYWVRGEESLILHTPTRGDVKLEILGLGRSVGTPEKGITGEVVSISSWEELKEVGEKGGLRNKIVLCNFRWTSYGKGSTARQKCAVTSEPYGAIAALVRSVTPFSLNTPHTGAMSRSKIPGASVTVEDAEYLVRLEKRAKTATTENKAIFKPPVVTLKMKACTRKNKAIIRNVIAEIKGREKPNEVLILSGHIDSWDVGVGALDDGAGAFIAWEALRQIAKLPQRPRRTIRAIFWTNEEAGSAGGLDYFERNKNKLEDHILAFESDYGTFSPYGLGFDGLPEARAILKQIGSELLNHTTFGNVLEGANGTTDVDPLCESGIPCAGITTTDHIFNIKPDSPDYHNSGYFVYHHTKGDRMEALNPSELNRCSAAAASYIYAIAELKETLPKKIVTPPPS